MVIKHPGPDVFDPGGVLAGLREALRWLRGEGNMRSASLVGAAEAVKARLDAAGGEVGNGAQPAARRRGVAAGTPRTRAARTGTPPGGLTDAAFRLIPLIEAGRSGAWPWEQQ